MKKQLICTVLSLFVGAMSLWGQSSVGTVGDSVSGKWQFSGITGLNASQTSLTNWAAGGENTVAGNVYLNAAANYKCGRWIWNNTVSTEFGLTHTNKWRKSVDKIELTSSGGYGFSDHWYASAMANLLTQYAKGYKNPGDPAENYISNFFAPAYLTVGLGAEYRPGKIFSVFLSPLTGKFTFVSDKHLSDLGSFGVKPGKNMFAEVGASVVAAVNMPVMKNMNLVSKATFFTAYTHNFGNVDINWEALLSMRVNKHISATVATSLVYDDDVKTVDAQGAVRGAKVQFKEIIGVGIVYNF